MPSTGIEPKLEASPRGCHRRLHRPILSNRGSGVELQRTTTLTQTTAPPLLVYLIRDMELAMRPDLQRLFTGDMLSGFGAVDGRANSRLVAPEPREMDRRAIQPTGILVLTAIVGRVLQEGLPVEEAAEERPCLRDVGDYNCRGGLADVPLQPFDAVGLGDGVVLGQDGAEDDEGAEGEDGAEGEFLREGEFGADEQREGDGHDQHVGGDVEDEGDDDVVGVDGALGALGWDGPVC